jgi:DNA-binding CsgD family transcriptional regulator
MAHDLTEMIYAAAHSADLWKLVAQRASRWLASQTVLCTIGTRDASMGVRDSEISMATGPHVDCLTDLIACVEVDAATFASYPPDLLLSSLSLRTGHTAIGEWLHIAGAVRGSRQTCHVAAARSSDEPPFSEGDAERFCGLARHLVRASSLGVARTENLSELRWEDAIDRMSVGVLVIGDDSRLLGANVEGRRLLASAHPLGLVNGKLRPYQTEKALELQDLVSKLARGELDRAAILMSDHDAHAGDILVGLVGAPSREIAENPRRCSHIFAYVSEIDKDYGRLETLLRQAFQLTKMESKTTIALIRGMGVDEAARSLGLGSATVRTHVKNVYSKTGVQRQSQLVHRALGTALALLA